MRRAGRSTSAPTTAASTRVDAKTGAIRWSYRGKGAIERPAEIGPDAGLHRQRRRPHRRARAGDREVALAVRARHARGVHDPRLRRSAPARRAAAGGVRRRLLRRRCRRPAARSCGRSRWRPRPTSSSTSIRRAALSQRRRRTCRRIRAGSTPSTRATAPCAGGWESRASATSPPTPTGSTSWRRATGCTPRTPTATCCGARG